MGVLCVLGLAGTRRRRRPSRSTTRHRTGTAATSSIPAVCLQPFPNDYFTEADPTRTPGGAVNLNAASSMPRNGAGKHDRRRATVNRNDGFGPGSLIITRVPGLDNAQAFQRTGSVPITDLARTYDRDAAGRRHRHAARGKRQLIWTEIDSNAQRPGERQPDHPPGRELRARATRYIVALRDLKDADGQAPSRPAAASALYRDGSPRPTPQRRARRRHMESIFTTLGRRPGIARKNLYLAWDFTVASETQPHRARCSRIRNDAFAPARRHAT